MEIPIIPLIKSNFDTKSDKYYAWIKLRRNTMSDNSDIYESIMDFFDNGYPEEFILFQQNRKIILDTSGTLSAGEKFNIYEIFIWKSVI